MTISPVDATHDPGLESWVESANDRACDFPIQNLPLGVFRRVGSTRLPAIGVAIGDQVLDLRACFDLGLLDELDPATRLACTGWSLNRLMAAGRASLRALRRKLSELLRSDSSACPADALARISDVELLLAVQIGDYTDFYASIDHAANVGALFRPDNPLLPNYRYVPVAYHGRASSIVASGARIRRPRGQVRTGEAEPEVMPTRMLDYEVEIGAYVGRGNALGQPIPIESAEEHLFGFCLLNDWSARDIQSWEYQPLGPFLAKSFATTVSPWVVTVEALAPFRSPLRRAAESPPPLPYLASDANQQAGAFGIRVECRLRTARMREANRNSVLVSTGRFDSMYWTPAQMIVHHSVNGCNLRAGDLLGSGTISGPLPGELGCLLEMTRRGAEPIQLGDEIRTFLEDGDEVILCGYCERDGFRRIGFGECRGLVLAAEY